MLVDPQVVGRTIELTAENVRLFGGTDPNSTNTLQVSSELFENFLTNGTLDGPASFVLGIESLVITTGEIQLVGGDSPGGFTALASFGEFTVNADNIVLQPGTAPGAHALLLGLGGLGDFTFNTCTGCGDGLLFSDPFLEDGPISGLFIAGLLQEPTIDAILAMLGQGGDDEEQDDDEEVNECSI
ncbi:MAG: hypothetical protein O3C28_08880 [Proteobacteria bacterium]|nr:hypothetical protein [Pseudomonadota bacterium]